MKTYVIAASLLIGALTVAVPGSYAAETSAQQSAKSEAEELKAFMKAIRAQYDLKEKAFAERDADTIVDNFYTPDVVSSGEGEDVMVGREAIRPLYKKVVEENDVKVESVYSRVSGKLGWDWANFRVIPRDKSKEPFTFKILFLWEKINGKWMCKGDLYVVGDMRNAKAGS